MKKGIVLDGMPHLEWAPENLTGHGGTEVDGRWYYTWEQAMAAAKEVGDGWRLPTRNEIKAFVKLGFRWDGDRKGCVFDGKLFLPASGYRHRTTGTLTNAGFSGTYWSSSPHSSSVIAGGLGFEAPNAYPHYYYDLSYGFSVRLVRDIR